MTTALVFAVFALLYAALIVWFTYGWWSLSAFLNKDSQEVSFSVIIPARNEARHIMQLLILLRNQHYPKAKHEVIVVDDHSSDATASIVERKIASGFLTNVRLLKADQLNGKAGKKNALALGIENAANPWIVTVDADCIMGRHWLETLAGFVEQQQPDMILGQVAVVPGRTLFSQLQSLEFMSLTGTAAGAAAIGKPIMCSGANMAFRRDYFEKVGGYNGNEMYASGDDVFLLHKFKKLQGTRISFLKSHGGLVYTRASASLKEFLGQRGRWAGKAGGYRDTFTMVTGLLVAALNLLLTTGIVLGLLFSGQVLLTTLLVLILKAVIDFPIVFSVSGFLRQRELMWLYPALSLIYPFYVTASLFSGFFLKPSWKA